MRTLLFSVTARDCDIQTFRSGGKGGQHQNKTESGVRIIHRASGAKGESREERSQHANKRIAWSRMARSDQMQKWLRIEAARHLGQPSIEALVDKAMSPENIRVDIKDDHGRWVPETPS